MPLAEAPASGKRPSGRERILEAAYDLFSRSGVRAIGVDTITLHADVAKMTLYRNFSSKHELAMAFLDLREERWSKEWLQTEVRARSEIASGQLLAIFDVFEEWFAREDFEGCAFVTSLLEFDDREDPVRQACIAHLVNIRAFIAELAEQAGIADPSRFATQWHILMKGAIVSAHEGEPGAALAAKEVAALLLERHGLELVARL